MRALPGIKMLAWTAGGWLVLAASCGRIDSPGNPAEALQVASSDAPAFTRGDARLSVAHAGVRRLEFPQVAGAGGSFREQIATDGRGRYSIQPLDASHATRSEWETFELLQSGREGFLFRYRDFLVRDPSLFGRNWTTVRVEPAILVAGRSCTQYRVERTVGAPIVFELSVDEGTGLVLASRELDAGGQLVAAMTYESVRFDPDLAAIAWHVPANEEQVLAPGAALQDFEQDAGPKLLQPRLLPRGYGPFETATVEDGQGTRWLKRTYSDGVEPLFFFQTLVEDARLGTPRGASPSGARLDKTPASASSVMVFEIGNATAIQGKVDGFDLIVIGKVPQEELLDMIESSLP